MKRTLLYYIFVLKSFVVLGDLITQAELEARLRREPNVTIKYYSNYPCPKYIILQEEYQNLSIEDDNALENLPDPLCPEIYSGMDQRYENLSISEASAFEQYSRVLNAEELANLPEDLQSKEVRVVDFETIINGFHDEALKNFAENLKNNKEALKKIFMLWVQEKTICAYYESIAYVPNQSIEDKCKANMATAIEKLLTYQAGRELLILVLCIENFKNKSLKIFINDIREYIAPNNDVFLKFSNDIICEVQAIYHEFNHWVHHVLGLYSTPKIAGNFSTPFEKKFLQMEEESFYEDNVNKAGNEIPCNVMGCFQCKDAKKTLKIFDIETTWEALEELWNIVGFANVNDVIYINHLSEMELLKSKPIWGYNCIYCYDSRYNDFLKNQREKGPKKPDDEAWKMWLKLHHFPENIEFNFLPELVDRVIEIIGQIFNIPKELSNNCKQILLEELFYSSDNIEYASKAFNQWKEQNPKLYEKMDTLKKDAEKIIQVAKVVVLEGAIGDFNKK